MRAALKRVFTAARICYFSRQIPPGARFAPMPRPGSFSPVGLDCLLCRVYPDSGIQLASFRRACKLPGCRPPRFRDQGASLLSGSIAFRDAPTPIPALNLLFFLNLGTYQACFPLYLRAGPATAFQAQEGENLCSDKTNHRLLTKPVVLVMETVPKFGNGDSSKCLVMVRVFKKYASGYSIMSPVLALVIRLISGSKR